MHQEEGLENRLLKRREIHQGLVLTAELSYLEVNNEKS